MQNQGGVAEDPTAERKRKMGSTEGSAMNKRSKTAAPQPNQGAPTAPVKAEGTTEASVPLPESSLPAAPIAPPAPPPNPELVLGPDVLFDFVYFLSPRLVLIPKPEMKKPGKKKEKES